MADVMKRDRTWSNIPPAGSKERDKWPSHVFLDHTNRKYPYKKYVNGKWKISCAGLLAAYRRANMQGNASIASKARNLAVRYGCPWAKKE